MSIADNFSNVRQKILAAEMRAGRKPNSVKLLAVSKGQPIEKIEQALKLGQTEFGENYVQELIEKIDLVKSAHFHFIGKLQSNKVRKIIGRVDLIHSIDSISLAQEVSKRAEQLKIKQEVLVEVNIAAENTKGGFASEEARNMLSALNSLKGLRLRGLMALPPYSENETEARGYLRRTYELFEKLRNELSMESKIEFSWVSMGTSHDYEWAIEEGATHVRVGTALFGEREIR